MNLPNWNQIALLTAALIISPFLMDAIFPHNIYSMLMSLMLGLILGCFIIAIPIALVTVIILKLKGKKTISISPQAEQPNNKWCVICKNEDECSTEHTVLFIILLLVCPLIALICLLLKPKPLLAK